MDSKNRNLLVLAMLCLTTALLAVQGYVHHRDQKALISALKEVRYAGAAAQASTELQMLRFLEAKDSDSAQELSASLLRSAESALAGYSPPTEGTEASRAIAATKQQIAAYRSR